MFLAELIFLSVYANFCNGCRVGAELREHLTWEVLHPFFSLAAGFVSSCKLLLSRDVDVSFARVPSVTLDITVAFVVSLGLFSGQISIRTTISCLSVVLGGLAEVSSESGFVKESRCVLTLIFGVPLSVVSVGLLIVTESIELIVGTCLLSGVGDIGWLRLT